jgi:hypothetical protein
MLRKTLSALLFTASVVTVSTANAAVVTFDPPPIVGGQVVTTSYTESGVSFTGSYAYTSTTVAASPGGDFFASNSSTGFVQLLFGSSMTIAMADSSLFSLGSVDLAEYSTVFVSPATITFTGYLSGGGTTSQTFTTDGVIDGPAGLADFESFVFNASFTGLASLVADTTVFSMDNLEVNPASVSAVPVPAAAFMFAPALLGFLGLRRKTNQST